MPEDTPVKAEKLARQPATKVNEVINFVISPHVITYRDQNGKVHDRAIMIPYSREYEAKLLQVNADFVGERTDYQTYARRMKEEGLKQLNEGKVYIKPQDVIAAERVEIERQKNQFEQQAWMIQAFGMMANIDMLHICPNCGHVMNPQEDEDESTHDPLSLVLQGVSGSGSEQTQGTDEMGRE